MVEFLAVRGWLGVALVAVCAAGAACRHGSAAGQAGAAPAARSPVHGRVVDRRTGAGLADRAVMAGGQRATTAADGWFTLPDVPAVYDLAIVDAGRERVTVYRKLSRRDPLLVHDARGPVDEWRARHSARLYANPTIDGRPPAGPTVMGFFAPMLAGVGDPVVLHWMQPPAIEGELLAVALAGAGPRTADASISSQVLSGWGAHRRLTVTPSLAATIDLPLAPLPRRRVTGAFSVPAGFEVSTLIESYRLPIPGADLDIRRDERDSIRGIDDELPDASALGASLCVTAIGDGPGTTGATRCRAGADGTFALTLDRPPMLTAPAQGAAFERDTAFAWSRSAAGIQVLQLTGADPAADRPDVTVYTPDATASWQALAGTGVAFPRGCSIYEVTAGGRGPYASMDEAFAPGGVGARLPAEARWSWSQPVTVTVPRWPRAEPGSFEAKLCHYPAGQGVVCTLPTNADDGEYYILSAINNKLRNFPAFTTSIGIYCVHDCDTARRFMKAWREYSAKHPGFDDHQPLDMEDC